jgi:deoxycytidylate deaminase
VKQLTHEFTLLFQKLGSSGCAKKHTAAGTYVDGVFLSAVNFCEYKGDSCPRLNMPSGTGYELCQAHHAEANLAEKVRATGKQSDGVLWLVGHYWACEPCASAVKAVGVKELRISEVE